MPDWAFVAVAAVAGLLVAWEAGQLSAAGWPYGEAVAVFWAGVLLIFVPAVFCAVRRASSRAERALVVVGLGIALFLLKVEASPHAFTFSDEFIQIRGTQNILASGRLFGYNPLLPTAAYYPGLAVITAGLVQVTGLSIFPAGLLVILIGRIVIIGALFGIAERVTHSARAAGVACMLYAANPMFIFFSASFAYEDLGLPLAFFALWWASRTSGTTRAVHLVTAVGVAAVIVTHHISGFALAAIFVAWWAAAVIVRAPVATRRRTAVLAVTAAAAFTAWFLVVARPAAAYIIGRNIEPDLKQLLQIAEGHMPVRQLYGGGAAPPEWWVIAGFAAIGLIIVALLAGLRRAWALLRVHKAWAADRAPLLAVAAIAACYPLTLLPRLTVTGGALSSRTSEYIYAALGCVIGLLLTQDLATDTVLSGDTGLSGDTEFSGDSGLSGNTGLLRDALPLQRTAPAQESVRQTGRTRPGQAVAALLAGRWGTVAAVVMIVIVFVGGVTIGKAYSLLLPQPAGVAGYPVSPQPDAIAAAAWARAHLGPNQPFVATATDSFALGDAGEDPLDGDDTYPVIFSSTLAAAAPTIRKTGARYILVDWQMTMWPPAQGYDGYLSDFEPGAGPAEKPLPVADLAKFTGPCIRLLATFGPIEVLDVSRIEDGACTPSLQETANRSH